MLAATKIGSALATGNSLVLKPLELTSFSAARVAELAIEAGMLEGVLNVIRENTLGRIHVTKPLIVVAILNLRHKAYAAVATRKTHRLEKVFLRLANNNSKAIR